MRKPAEFAAHPVSFTAAQEMGRVRAVGKHVVDGDTFHVLVDVGFHCYSYATVRLLDIDTPELIGKNRARALAARDYVASLVLDQPLLLKSYRDTTTFGRFVAEVWVLIDGEWTDLVEHLRAAGWDSLREKA